MKTAAPPSPSSFLSRPQSSPTHAPCSLLLAAEFCRPVILRQLLADGHDSQQPDYYGTTPLQATCKIGNLAIVTELLQHGADDTSSSSITPPSPPPTQSPSPTFISLLGWRGTRRLHSSAGQRVGKKPRGSAAAAAAAAAAEVRDNCQRHPYLTERVSLLISRDRYGAYLSQQTQLSLSAAGQVAPDVGMPAGQGRLCAALYLSWRRCARQTA